MKTVRVVAAVIRDNNRIFATQRGYGDLKGGWEFPGGKMEQGESEIQTLERELREELEIKVEILDKFYQVEHDYPDFHLSMALYECKMLSHNFKMNVHKDIKWVKPQDMLSLDWAEADLPVAEKLVRSNDLACE